MLRGPKTELSGVLAIRLGWRSSVRWVTMASLLSSLSCSSIWDPFLLTRCANGEACGRDMSGSGTSDMLPNGASDFAGMPPTLFGTATNFLVGSGPNSVAVGDFNGDMKLDVVSANSNSNNVSVLLGSGLGGLGAADNFQVGSRPNSVAVGDESSIFFVTSSTLNPVGRKSDIF